tara:strand:- start:263 stop:907 length:645 start_codon:yes stop_codon:yes gene_type:complete
MADKKISQLTAATTPLAGTEVLPIVQGGATTKVAVSDLTNGRAVTAGSMSIGSAINAGWGSTTRVVQTSLSGALSGSTAGFRAVVSNNLYFDNTNWKYMYGIGASNYEQNAGNHYWFTAPSGTADNIANLSQVMTILQADNNIKANVGNFTFGTAGKGIVFEGDGSVIWRTGANSPEGVVTAPVGSLFTRTNGGANTTLYVKESGAGNTGWVAK